MKIAKRVERFGSIATVSDLDKKNSRAERFGVEESGRVDEAKDGGVEMTKSEKDADEGKKMARAARFGTSAVQAGTHAVNGCGYYSPFLLQKRDSKYFFSRKISLWHRGAF